MRAPTGNKSRHGAYELLKSRAGERKDSNRGVKRVKTVCVGVGVGDQKETRTKEKKEED